MDPFGPPPLIFSLVPIFIGVVAIIVVGGILYSIIKGVSEWSYNNGQPVLTSPARVVAKRTDVSSRRHMGTSNHFHSHTDTTYYVTFELASGERREIRLNGSEYGQLVEGDEGDFTYQGTRYHGFVRRH